MMESREEIIKKLDANSSKILQHQITDVLVQAGLTFLVLAIIGDIAIIYGVYTDEGISQNTIIAGSLFVGFIIGLLILRKYDKQFKVENHQLVFKKFYNFFKDLDILELDDKTIKQNVKDIKDFADDIKYWVVSDAPLAIHKLPDSISDNLKENTIKIFEKNDSKKIKEFVDYLLTICVLLNQRDLSYDEWDNFANNLVVISTGQKIPKHLPKIDEIRTDIVESSFEKISIPKPIKSPVFAGISIGLLILILGIFENSKLSETVYFSVIAGSTLGGIMKGTQIFVRVKSQKLG